MASFLPSPLTSILQGGHLNFSTWVMKNTLFAVKNIKLQNKQHFVENKTEIIQHVLKCNNFPCSLNT